HNVSIVTTYRSYEVEPGSLRVARLDPIDTIDTAEQPILIAHRQLMIGEILRAEITVVAWKPLLDRSPELGLIAGGGDLFVVRQTGCVSVARTAHAEGSRLVRHSLRKVMLVATDRFGNNNRDVIG